MWWGGSAPQFDLADRTDRARAYELVLREGRPGDIRSIVDGALLIDSWPELVVPADLRQEWQPIVDEYRLALAEASRAIYRRFNSRSPTCCSAFPKRTSSGN